MADSKICDCCGSPGAHRIEVAVVMHGVVTEGQPTGLVHAMDVCPGCRPAEAAKLQERARVQIERDIPIHREIIARRANTAALKKAKDDAVIARDASKLAESSSEYRKLDGEVTRRMEELQANEDTIQALIDSAK